jgi:uncharacterized protein (DUF433 family)
MQLTEMKPLGIINPISINRLLRSLEATMRWKERIIIDPGILVGKPVIKGTRLSVEFIIDLLAQGWNEQDILRNYPGITRQDIQACLAYASETLKVEKVYAFPLGGK